jgi:DNA processing protein
VPSVKVAPAGPAEFDWVEVQWKRLSAEGGRCLVPGDASYPELLGQISSRPPILFALGPDDLLGPTVAIVGPRKASGCGLQIAGELARGLVQCGVCIVSGMAYGVDAAANEAALAAGGRTIAVLGCGPDVPYPRAHTGLHARSANAGRSFPNSPGVANRIGRPFRSATGLSAD